MLNIGNTTIIHIPIYKVCNNSNLRLVQRYLLLLFVAEDFTKL